MPLIGGKNAKKKSSSSSTKRHFTVVIGNKEHGLYVSSSPSSAARKAVSKLCATDKKRKVEFHIREITQGSKKKTYGPYLGYIEKLKEPIELKGRIIKYKPVAKLLGKKTKTGGALAKKKGSVLVVESKDGKVRRRYITKKQADKHMKPRHKRLDKGMKTYHKGGEFKVARRAPVIPEENESLHLLAKAASKLLKPAYYRERHNQAASILSTMRLPNINKATFITRQEIPNEEFISNIKIGSIIECNSGIKDERWFGIVTEIADSGEGVYLIWFDANTFNLEKEKRPKEVVDFDVIIGILRE